MRFIDIVVIRMKYLYKIAAITGLSIGSLVCFIALHNLMDKINRMLHEDIECKCDLPTTPLPLAITIELAFICLMMLITYYVLRKCRFSKRSYMASFAIVLAINLFLGYYGVVMQTTIIS